MGCTRPPNPHRIPALRLILVLPLLGGSGCTDLLSSDRPEPGRIERLGDISPTGVVDELLPEPVGVQVSSPEGEPLGGIRVSWAAHPGAGRFEAADDVTDAEGIARARWHLGTQAGSQTGSAGILDRPDLPEAQLRAIASSGPAVTLELNASEVSLEVGEPGQGLAPRFADAFDNSARAPDGGMIWWSSAPEVVEVDESGRLLPLREGEATVGLEAGTLEASARVQVLPSTLTATIEGAYFVQTVQTFEGDVPLIEGRPTLLRVFATVSRASLAESPPVRARFSVAGALVETIDLEPGAERLSLEVEEGDLRASWNLDVPGELVRPGLSVLLELDPESELPLAERSGLTFPASGEPLELDVRRAPPFEITFVPVTTSATGLTGTVDEGSAPAYLERARRMFPLDEIDVAVREPYVTDIDSLEADNANGAWTSLLSEINAMRLAEGSSRHYYGVVELPYSGGFAGFGYVGGRAAVGFDRFPGAVDLLTHEIGHNFGRYHAPCGGAGSPDLNFPYSDARIGHYGYDAWEGTVIAPGTRDIMSYCYGWISDYTYRGVIEHREDVDGGANATGSPTASERGPRTTEGEALLLWGRITADGLVLEPAFRVTAARMPAVNDGSYRVEMLDGDGAMLADWRFDPIPLDHSAEEHFAFLAPMAGMGIDRLERLRVVGPAGEAVRTASVPADPPGAERAPANVETRRVADHYRLDWDAASFPAALVRDPETGRVLSIVRGGRASVPGRLDRVDLVLSDGVRSRTLRVDLEPR